MRFIPINAVKEGSYLGKTIYDNDGVILLKEGVILTANIIQRIKNVGIYSLYISDEYSEIEIEDTIKPEIRQKAVVTIKKAFDNFHQYNKHLNNPSMSLKQKSILKSRESYIKSISNISKEIVNELLSKKDLLINLVDIKSMDNYTYQHCVNVAVLSLILGIELQLNKFELYDLCIGAMLHDIGKMLIPSEIIKKDSNLTIEEFNMIKEHPLRGYEYLKGSFDISAPARAIILQHHEKYNGEGYPNGLKKNEISKLSRIVALADVYDALTSDRPYRKALCPNEAMEYIMGSGGTHFDYSIVKAFASRIIPYPEGTLVKLSNNDIGVVESLNIDYPLRPKLKIVSSDHISRKGIEVDLLLQKNIVIKGVQYEAPNHNVS